MFLLILRNVFFIGLLKRYIIIFPVTKNIDQKFFFFISLSIIWACTPEVYFNVLNAFSIRVAFCKCLQRAHITYRLLTNSILLVYVHTKHNHFLYQMRVKMVKCQLKYFYILYFIYFMLVFFYDQCTLLQ